MAGVSATNMSMADADIHEAAALLADSASPSAAAASLATASVVTIQSDDSNLTSYYMEYEQRRRFLAYTHVINFYVLPPVCFLGVMAATMCIIVFTRRQMRSSLNVYLAGLSFFDLILLLMSLIIYPLKQGCEEEGDQGFVCHLFWRSTLYTYPASLIAQTGSVWTCVAVTVDRFLAVNYPLKFKIWCRTSRAVVMLAFISFASVVYRIPTMFELTVNEDGMLSPTLMRMSEAYIQLYITYGYLFVMVLVPWTIMIVFNASVIMTVRRAYQQRRTMQTNNSHEEKDRRCTIMALVMILTFIVFNMIAATCNVMELFHLMPHSKFGTLISIGNLLVCLNSASNIIIYSLFGARFRLVCIQMLCGRDSRWNTWLRVGRVIMSEDTTRDPATGRTSLEASQLLSRSSHWSKRSTTRGSEYRKDTYVYNSTAGQQHIRIYLQPDPCL